jgi:uncharacterized protein with PIN domain
MKQDDFLGIVGHGGSPFTDLISPLFAAAAIRDSRLSKEEKAERAERLRLFREERERKAKVIQNICPDCDGKLARGKKDKKNNYKRQWNCKDCGNSHSI